MQIRLEIRKGKWCEFETLEKSSKAAEEEQTDGQRAIEMDRNVVARCELRTLVFVELLNQSLDAVVPQLD